MLSLGLSLPVLIALLATLVISLSFHEFAHAWSAVELGDDTPRLNGRLSLNPLAHLDPVGALAILLVGFGWAKPVPVNPYNFRNPRLGMTLVSIAGPFANFILALLAAIPYRTGGLELLAHLPGGSGLANGLLNFLYTFMYINLSLMVFNLIPLGPLDGAKVLRGLAPREWDTFLLPLEQWGMFILLGLMMLGRFGSISIFGLIMSPITDFLAKAIMGI